MAARQTARCLPSPADAFASLPLRARGLSVVLVPLQARMRTFLAAFRGERLASRRLRSVLFAEKRYKEVLRAKTAVVLVPLQAIMRRFKTRFRRRWRDSARTREHANMGEHPLFACSRVRAFATRASRSRQPQPKSRVSSGSARCCGTPRDRPRSEARYTRCGPIRCTRSAKRR